MVLEINCGACGSQVELTTREPRHLLAWLASPRSSLPTLYAYQLEAPFPLRHAGALAPNFRGWLSVGAGDSDRFDGQVGAAPLI
jgi:hypothetical protein